MSHSLFFGWLCLVRMRVCNIDERRCFQHCRRRLRHWYSHLIVRSRRMPDSWQAQSSVRVAESQACRLEAEERMLLSIHFILHKRLSTCSLPLSHIQGKLVLLLLLHLKLLLHLDITDGLMHAPSIILPTGRCIWLKMAQLSFAFCLIWLVLAAHFLNGNQLK